jgi:uncharacterized repeat protein (TIGR03803 family)
MKANESGFTIAGALAVFVAILMFVSNAIAAGPTERVLYRFKGGSDGSAPAAGLIADAAGNLYGTTTNGGAASCQGGCGTVFELSPLCQSRPGGWQHAPVRCRPERAGRICQNPWCS